ncbi:MAG: hypothetical protein ACOCU6_01390 [Nanoarchaeota archaeon]
MDLFVSKKAVMGVGMVFIFIATVLASAIASAVLISSTESIEERAYQVQEDATERLLTGFEIISVYASGNMDEETINEFEIILRLRAGSKPIDFTKTGFSFISGNLSLAASYNETLGNENCTFGNLGSDSEFCVAQHFETEPSLMVEGDMASLKYKLDESDSLETEDDLMITIQTPKGMAQVLELSIPDMILSTKIKLR